MTNWLPSIEDPSQPLYIEIADAIEEGITNGELKVGSKLPPLRNVAFDIGVTVGTVSRAYALACERGLVSGEVGRGTYVLAADTPALPSINTPPEMVGNNLASKTKKQIVNFGYTSATDIGQSQTIASFASEISKSNPGKIMDYIREIPQEWRVAGQNWLSNANWIPDIENVIPTNGAHAAIVSIITSITSPGDKIAFEGLTYCSLARATQLLGRRIVITEFDESGIIPESFERLCAQQHPKLLYTMPSVQNPTLAKLSLERRKQIAEIAHRYNVYVVEDAIYAPLVDDETPPISYFLPDRGFNVGGLSKAVSAGIRAGWVSCPPRYATRISNAHKMATGGASYWLTELASQLVLSDEADRISQNVKEENKERLYLARIHLGNHQYNFHDTCPYLWLKLPEPWLSGTFKKALEEEGIVVSGEDEFKPARSDRSFYGVRLGLSSFEKREDLNAPFKKISALLDSGISGFANQG